MKFLRPVLAWAMAVVLAVVAGSIIQTQFNLAAIERLGAEVGFGQWLATTGHDLVHFTPTYAMLVAIAFAVAWPVAGILKRWWPDQRQWLFLLAGFAAILTLILVMNRALPVTGIAATRCSFGTVLLAAAGGLAGWLYARVLKPGSRG